MYSVIQKDGLNFVSL